MAGAIFVRNFKEVQENGKERNSRLGMQNPKKCKNR
jgi:hypothetical protein